MQNGRFLIVITVLLILASISACTGSNSTTAALKFSLYPHGPDEAPLVPHSRQVYTECDLCHIDPSNAGSSIKILESHSCDVCHKSLDYTGACQETMPANSTCTLETCHAYP